MPMRKAFFCYERSLKGWTPVIYWDYKPEKSANAYRVERTEFHEIPPRMFGVDGEPNFHELMVNFPIQKEQGDG